MAWRWTTMVMVAVPLCLGACQVRGLIGSNADGSGSGGSTMSTTSSETADATTQSVTSRVSASGSGDTSTTGGGQDPTTTFVFDVWPDELPRVCAPPMPVACDADDDDLWHAMGLGCPGGVEIDASFTGDPRQSLVFEGPLGQTGEYAPREGEKFVILSTGVASHVPMSVADLQALEPECSALGCPSTSLGTEQLLVLPPPLDVRRVAGDRDCARDPSLVGEGDCSNSLEEQWLKGDGARDYVELRIRTTVPDSADAFSYDFAFFSSEYPLWAVHESVFNDMYVAWLESEAWTGNISFDDHGHPITVNSVLLDYQSGQTPECETTPEVPELAGFSMQCHGGTRWLTTTAPVRSGEEIQVVLALFDLSDGTYDSVVAIDNFEWTCSGSPPVTVPAG